jgi:hypothetical protein
MSLRAALWTRTEDRLVADGWMQERSCRVTIDAGAFVTVATPDIVVRLLERRPGRQCVLQVGSGRTIPVVREALVEVTLVQRNLKIWEFAADITDEFILGRTTRQWTWGAMCYDWARMSCQ